MRREWVDYGFLGGLVLVGWVTLGEIVGIEKRDEIGWSLTGLVVVYLAASWVGGRVYEWHRTRIYHPIPVIPDEQACAIVALAEAVRKMHRVDMARYRAAFGEVAGLPAYKRAVRRIDRIAFEACRLDSYGREWGELLAVAGAATVAEAVACRDLISERDFDLVTRWWTDLGLILPVIDPVLRCWVCSAARRPNARVVMEWASDGGRRGVCQVCGATSPWAHPEWDGDEPLLMVGGPNDPAWWDLFRERVTRLAGEGRKVSHVWMDPPLPSSSAIAALEAMKAEGPRALPEVTGGFPVDPGCLDSDRVIAVGQWLGSDNQITRLNRRGRRWTAFDSTGALYWSDEHPEGLRTSDRPVSPERRQLARWPS
jgi:hypothetical protein